MFAIDHIPVAHHDLERLAAVFAAAGFGVSRRCIYESPDDSTGPWTCRSIFLDHGWLDLQHTPARPADRGAAPQACLFRVPSLTAMAPELARFRFGPAVRLSRQWEGDDAPDLDLAWMSLRERIAPFVLALATYPSRGPAEALAAHPHANSAIRLLGFTFGAAEPGPFAETAARHLDLSGFLYLPQAEFESRFGRPPGVLTALRIQVASLEHAATALRTGGLSYGQDGASVFVPAQGDLACGLEFVAEAG